MINLSFDKINLEGFWDKTPTPLKYLLVFVIFITVGYFVFSKNVKDHHVLEMESMRKGIDATYSLMENFERFKRDQDAYNKEVIGYLKSLRTLIEELNFSTNRKLDIIIREQSSRAVIEKIELLNESFERISKAYQIQIESPGIQQNENKNPPDIGIGVRKKEGSK